MVVHMFVQYSLPSLDCLAMESMQSVMRVAQVPWRSLVAVVA